MIKKIFEATIIWLVGIAFVFIFSSIASSSDNSYLAAIVGAIIYLSGILYISRKQ